MIPASLAARALKNKEGVDVYDFREDFTPMKYFYKKIKPKNDYAGK